MYSKSPPKRHITRVCDFGMPPVYIERGEVFHGTSYFQISINK